jgi:hypothetical protein
LANNPENIAMLMRDGAVEAMTGAIANAGDNEALLSVAIAALANMAISKDFCKVIEEKVRAAGGSPRVEARAGDGGVDDAWGRAGWGDGGPEEAQGAPRL